MYKQYRYTNTDPRPGEPFKYTITNTMDFGTFGPNINKY